MLPELFDDPTAADDDFVNRIFLDIFVVIFLQNSMKNWSNDKPPNLQSFQRQQLFISKVFANDSRDRVSIPGWVIPKTQKMILDAALINTQNYKVRIKGKMKQSREWSSAHSYTSVL